MVVHTSALSLLTDALWGPSVCVLLLCISGDELSDACTTVTFTFELPPDSSALLLESALESGLESFEPLPEPLLLRFRWNSPVPVLMIPEIPFFGTAVAPEFAAGTLEAVDVVTVTGMFPSSVFPDTEFGMSCAGVSWRLALDIDVEVEADVDDWLGASDVPYVVAKVMLI